MGQNPIRIVIVDDHDIIRQGLAALMEDEADLEVVARGANGQQAITLVRSLKPDIILLDITLNGMSGLEAMRHIREEQPVTSIIILTMHEESTFFYEAFLNGAAGYFLKGSHSKELLKAIRTVHGGGIYLPPKLAGMLIEEFMNHPDCAPLDTWLTAQEHELLTLINQGLSEAEVAQQLAIPNEEVHAGFERILEKMNLTEPKQLWDYLASVTNPDQYRSGAISE